MRAPEFVAEVARLPKRSKKHGPSCNLRYHDSACDVAFSGSRGTGKGDHRCQKTGEELEPLFVGKIGPGAIPIVRELQLRGVLRPPPLRPRYLDYEEVGPRLERARQGLSVLDLLPGKR